MNTKNEQKQAACEPNDPVLVFRAALAVRRQALVDQQEIVRRRADTFGTRAVREGLKRSEETLASITQELKRIYDGMPPPPHRRKATLARIDRTIVRFQRILNGQRLRLVWERNKYVMNVLNAGLARYDDLDLARPERALDLVGIF